MNGININTEINIFKENLTARPFCRNFKDERVRILPKDKAINYNNIQTDHPHWQNYFVIDIDTNWLNVLDKTELKPNILVSNKENARAHLFFRIEALCKTESARIKPLKYAASIERSLCFHLEGDSCFNNQTTKNPMKTDFYKVLSFRDKAYSFSELHEYLDLSKRVVKQQEVTGLLRNCEMFDIVRYKAYEIAKTYQNQSNFDSFYKFLLNYAEKNNTFKNPLAISEINSVVKSVAKWTFKNYRGSNANRGRDKLKTSLLTDLRDKQIVSASETNKQRKNDTERKIRSAIYSIKADSNKVTQKRISEVSGLGIATVKRHSKLIKSLK